MAPVFLANHRATKKHIINALYLSVNVFSKKILIGTLFLRLLLETGPPFLRSYPSHAKVQPFAAQRQYLHFSVTLSIGLAPEIEPATSCSAVKRSTNWASPAAVKKYGKTKAKVNHLRQSIENRYIRKKPVYQMKNASRYCCSSQGSKLSLTDLFVKGDNVREAWEFSCGREQ